MTMEQYIVQPLDLMQYINTKYHEPFIHEWIAFDRPLDQKKLIEAIDKLITIFPILKCRYDSENNRFIENDLNGNDLLKINDSRSRVSLLTESLDMNEKLIQFTLVGTTLTITISHLVCDGNGFKNLIYLLCDLYNRNEISDPLSLMKRDFSQLTEQLKPSSGMMLKMLTSMLFHYKNTKIYEKGDKENDFLIEHQIDSTVMCEIKARAKMRQATINDVFLTAYARAIAKLYQQRKINIPCTVDLRKYAKKPNGIANLTGSYNLNVKINKEDDFAKTLSLVSKKMKKQKETKNDIAGPMLLTSKYEKSTLEQFKKIYGNMNTSAFTDFTNLGIIDDQRLSFQGVHVQEAVGFSGLNKAPCFQIAISTFKNKMTISSLFHCSEKEKKKAEFLFYSIVNELMNFCH